MAAQIDSALQAELNLNPTTPIGVELEFSGPPPLDRLKDLGLRVEGTKASGRLSATQIQAFAAAAGVLSICLLQAAAPPDPPSGPTRVGFRLEQALEDPARTQFDVIVTFRDVGKPIPEIPMLSVHRETGNGRLSREDVLQLIKRDDIQEIELTPELELH